MAKTMTVEEGTRLIEDLIDLLGKECEDDIYLELLEEMMDRAETSRDAREEELEPE